MASELDGYLMLCSGFGAKRVFDAMFWHVTGGAKFKVGQKKIFETFGLICVLNDSESISKKNFFRKFSNFLPFLVKNQFFAFSNFSGPKSKNTSW